jgi:hypothetical protein
MAALDVSRCLDGEENFLVATPLHLTFAVADKMACDDVILPVSVVSELNQMSPWSWVLIIHV